MARFKWDMGSYLQDLEKLKTGSTGIIKQAVYDGAAVVADEIKAS